MKTNSYAGLRVRVRYCPIKNQHHRWMKRPWTILTEKQYDNILEKLTKVQLLLEETTANFARQIETGASIQGLYGSAEYPLNKTSEQLAERQPEQLAGRPEQLETK
jgi:hypothetical protein